MKFAVLLLFTLSFINFSCQNTRENSTAGKNETDSTKFFQVNQYIKSQIDEVNKTPYFIYRIENNNGRRDSSAINTAIFNQLSATFLTPDISNEGLKPSYKESIFEDQTTNSFTISYSSLNKQLEVQNIEILLKDDARTVKRIFIRKFFNYKDSSAIEQLSWKPNESFQINRSVQKEDKTESNRQITVVWNQEK